MDSLMVAMALLHLVASPYTKVEESFNLQAAHDIMVYGTPPDPSHSYDHFVFAGAVPRTFVGAALLAALAKPFVWAAGFHHAQFVVRALLAAANAASLVLLRRTLLHAAGAPAATWWALLMLGQFHVWYYLSRTLPNMFAFGLTTTAFACLLSSRRAAPQALGLLALAAAVFRAELAILLAATGLHLLATRTTSLPVMARVVAMATALGLALSLPLDSYFWQTWLWPELWAFHFNALLGSSSLWGTEPWHYYLTSALPRLLLNPLALPLACLAVGHVATRPKALSLLVPSALYLALYSLQPHKETRFVLYLVPPLTCLAAMGAALLSTRRHKSLLYRLATLLLAASLVSCFAASLAMLALSSLNYPGGDALAQLRALARHQSPASGPPLRVHADVLTCMTGLTLFGQNPDGLPLALYPAHGLDALSHVQQPLLLFDRTEDAAQLAQPDFWLAFDYALAENPRVPLGAWDIVGVVAGFDGMQVLGPGTPDHHHQHRLLGRGAHVAALQHALRPWTGGWWLGPRMAPRIYILKRRPGPIAAF
ncbi:hypothetical protein CDD82_2134 [Ophiocordyceps australis]|uniref:Mannosyltransferase n=1 Tax=Ophiocordyceps australis TaxID=1399860 RepID=A0A2C5XGA8_9HYPO|nr:hypothetical protein CDD82_2134 [Ophiocordyceps australis]